LLAGQYEAIRPLYHSIEREFVRDYKEKETLRLRDMKKAEERRDEGEERDLWYLR